MTSSPDDLSGDPDDLLLLAVEECGHAVMAWLEGAALERVTLTPDGDGGCSGRAQYWPTWDATSMTDAIKSARISLAGPIAAMIYTDSDQVWNDDAHDIEEAEGILSGTGIPWRELVPRVRAELDREWPRLLRLTKDLLERQTLSGAEATGVIEGCSGN